MKRILWFLAIIIICLNINKAEAQIDMDLHPERSKQRILILPFDPSIYVNDASMIWSKQSGLSHEEIRDELRIELNRRLHLGMIDSCESVDLLTSYTKEARNDLMGLYTCVYYELRRAMPNVKEDAETEDRGPLDKIFKKKEKPYTDTVVNARRHDGEIQGRRYPTHDKYLHILFDNPDFIPELCRRRDLDKVLFVNQMEITGNYGNPYMSGNPDATRTIKVHYSLFNFNGRLLHGGFASVEIPFHLDDYQEVMEDYFPTIVRQIILNIDFKK